MLIASPSWIYGQENHTYGKKIRSQMSILMFSIVTVWCLIWIIVRPGFTGCDQISRMDWVKRIIKYKSTFNSCLKICAENMTQAFVETTNGKCHCFNGRNSGYLSCMWHSHLFKKLPTARLNIRDTWRTALCNFKSWHGRAWVMPKTWGIQGSIYSPAMASC